VLKQASWLNMVEIEIGVLRGQCFDRRIGTLQRLQSAMKCSTRPYQMDVYYRQGPHKTRPAPDIRRPKLKDS